MIKNNKGFTLVLALIILVLLSVMLGLFITMVSVNLRHANRFVAKSSIEQIAENGIDYCNKMLLTSADGADWRPVPDNISMKDGWKVNDINSPAWDVRDDVASLSVKDPDYKWLVPYWPKEVYNNGILIAGPDGGWTRMNSGDDRFLLRVNYAPVVKDVNSDSYIANVYDSNAKFIKIECIARKGSVDTDDPTTMNPYSNNENQFYLLAYKPIGITDYARFITNKDGQKKTFEIGNGRIREELGRVNTRYTKRGGPIRVNGNVKFDNVKIDLRGLKHNDPNGNTVYTPRDFVEITGTMEDEDVIIYDENYNDITDDVNYGDFVKESQNDTHFVSSLEAPLIDQKVYDSTTTRYRQLTKNTGVLFTEGDSKGRKAGEFGWGDGIYINNTGDVQRQSETLFGGYTLRSDWLIPGNKFSGTNWQGPYYIPKGVQIELTPKNIIIKRSDFSSQNMSSIWRDETGKLRPEWGSTVSMDYPKNGVLFAEGNIRIKGMLPEDTQLTVVSNENIYIEGNLLKNRPANTNFLNGVDTEDYKIADDSCAVSLLARKNVVVNTTMFMKPIMSIDSVESDYGTNEPPYHLVLDSLSTGTSFAWQFQFGPYESEENLFDGREWHMAIRHSADIDSVDAFLQTYCYVNPGGNNLDWLPIKWGEENARYFTGVPSYKNTVYGGSSLTSISNDNWKYKSNIYKLYDTDFGNSSMIDNQYLKIFLGNESKGKYILGNLAVNPLDVRIEALIYAQNGSFFVIPGYWYEPDFDKYNDNVWDFGKPLDIRVIVDGAVSENVCASKSDQISWMEKWGRTYHPDTNKSGSPIYGKNSYHNGDGFTMLYDDTITYPLTGKEPVRYDIYGRVLPITPKLPVSQTLIYKGIAE